MLIDKGMQSVELSMVVGNRGLGTVKRLVAGSVSEGVVSLARSPVLVMRGYEAAWPPAAWCSVWIPSRRPEKYRRRSARHEKERPRDDHPSVTERVRLATLAERNATPNTSPSKTCPSRSASRMPRPSGTAGSQAGPELSRGDGALDPA